MYYTSPTEVRHWIPKAQLCIKYALEELENAPHFKNNPDSPEIGFCGTDGITSVSYSYTLLGLAFELIYKTFLVSNFKPLIMGRTGHELTNIHTRLNEKTKRIIETHSQNLVDDFGIPYISNNTSILGKVDMLMTNADVKYNNIPNKLFSPFLIKNAEFTSFGYNRTLAIAEFMSEIADVADNMLCVSAHIISHTDKVCPNLSPSKQQDRKSIFLACSKFIEDFEVEICNGKVSVICSEASILKIFPESSGFIIPLIPIGSHPSGIVTRISLTNNFTSSTIRVIVRS